MRGLMLGALTLTAALAAACNREPRAVQAETPAQAPAAPAAAAPATPTPVDRVDEPAPGPGVDPGGAGCDATMAAMAAGTFTSKRGGAVTVAPFCLDRTEVTVAAYRRCVDEGKCTEPDAEAGEACNWNASGDPPAVKRADHPVNCVDQAQAAAYCAAQGQRLPSAAEFEWAQRGGDAGTAFPWGDDELPRRVCARANKNPDYPRAPVTCPVGSCPAGDSPEQVHDLSGNLAEWTASAGEADERLVCGGQTSCQAGSVNRIGKALAAGSCLAQSAPAKFEGVGFRCARSR